MHPRPYLDAKHSALVATDGYILAYVPVEILPDEPSGHLPPVSLRNARKYGRAVVEEGFVTTPDEAAFKRLILGGFPKWEQFMKHPGTRLKRAPDLLIDASLLLRLAKGDRRPQDVGCAVAR